MPGVWLDSDGNGESGFDEFLIEHFVSPVNVGQNTTVTIHFVLIEFKTKPLAMTKAKRKFFSLAPVLLLEFRGINTDEANFHGPAPRFNEQRIAVYNFDERDELGRGNGGEECDNQKDESENGLA